MNDVIAAALVTAVREAERSQAGSAGCCPTCAAIPDEWAPNRGHDDGCSLAAAILLTKDELR